MIYDLSIIGKDLDKYQNQDYSNFIIPNELIKPPSKVCIRDSDGIFRIFEVSNITYFEANRKETNIYFKDGSMLPLKSGIGKVEELIEHLPSFTRVQRKYIINIDKITWYDPVFRFIGINSGTFKKRIPVGQEYVKKFDENMFNHALVLNPTKGKNYKNYFNFSRKAILSAILSLACLYEKALKNTIPEDTIQKNSERDYKDSSFPIP